MSHHLPLYSDLADAKTANIEIISQYISEISDWSLLLARRCIITAVDSKISCLSTLMITTTLSQNMKHVLTLCVCVK